MPIARTYLVAYDIHAPRRLRRVHHALSKVGYAQQYSVFAADLADWERVRLASQLQRLIDKGVDDVRFYLVPDDPRGAWHGPLPFGRVVCGAPAASLAERLSGQHWADFDTGPSEPSART